MSNSIETTASTPSCSTFVSSSTSTGSRPSTAVPGVSATSSGTAARRYLKNLSSTFTATNSPPTGMPARRSSSGSLSPRTRMRWRWCRAWRPTYAFAVLTARSSSTRNSTRRRSRSALTGRPNFPRRIYISSSPTCVSSPANLVGSRPRASCFTRAPRETSPSNSPRTATVFARYPRPRAVMAEDSCRPYGNCDC